MTHELSMIPRLGLEVSPALISFAEMLLLPYPAMESMVEEELGANPALERLEAGECPVCRSRWRTRCPACSTPANARGDEASWRVGELGDHAPDESDSRALLREVRMEVEPSGVPIAEYLVASLDRHGQLDRSCAELAADLGVEESAVRDVLAVVRRIGPPGVGATSIEECLLLQLAAADLDAGQADLVRAVIAAHLPALAKGHFTSIAAALGVTPAEIKAVLEEIRRTLRPYPAFGGNETAVACDTVPDVVVRPHDEIPGEFRVEVVEPALIRLSVRNAPGGASRSRARSFLAQLGDRWETVRRVVECAVEHQKRYLLLGPGALRPLTRAQVAAELGLHESTVSRALADKYALLPDQTIAPLAMFFSASGGLDEELRALLTSSDGAISDQRLADLLRAAGYPIARRTVAKHRARLGIAAASLR